MHAKYPPSTGSEAHREPDSATRVGVSRIRRNLVKGGAFIPPLLLSFRGSAAVTAASHNACLAYTKRAAQESANSDPDFALAASPDTWLRAPVIAMEARRVRKKRGIWRFKSQHVVKTYTHEPPGTYPYYSVRPGRRGRKAFYRDTGRAIQIYDASGTRLEGVGKLLYRNGNPKLRYVGLTQEPRYGIVALTNKGKVMTDLDGKPMVQAIAPEDVDLQNASQSCWASLDVASGTQLPT